MKKVLCFGDSNTYGYNPETGGRFSEKERWCGILKILAKNSFDIIEAGCNNRTAFSLNDSIDCCGFKSIKKYLKNNLYMIILQIGINDLQTGYNNSIADFKEKFENFIEEIRKNCTDTEIMLIVPSVIKDNILNSNFSFAFDSSSIEKSKFLPGIYKDISRKYNYELVDLNKIAEVSEIDGLHYTKTGHKKIAEHIYKILSDKECFIF